MLPSESKIFVHDVNRKIFWEVLPLCPPPGNFSVKTQILVGLIAKW